MKRCCHLRCRCCRCFFFFFFIIFCFILFYLLSIEKFTNRYATYLVSFATALRALLLKMPWRVVWFSRIRVWWVGGWLTVTVVLRVLRVLRVLWVGWQSVPHPMRYSMEFIYWFVEYVCSSRFCWHQLVSVKSIKAFKWNDRRADMLTNVMGTHRYTYRYSYRYRLSISGRVVLVAMSR